MSDPVSAWIAEGKKLRGDRSTERMRARSIRRAATAARDAKD